MLKQFGAAALAGAMLASSLVSATSATNQGALAPGKPAAVKQAQEFHGRTGLLWVLGAGIVVGGIVLVATGNSHGTASTSTASD
jgi:hypothetical protein